MPLGDPALPFGLDPLIAEAKRRAKRRRAVVLVLAIAAVGTALGVALAMRGPGSSPFTTQFHSAPTPPGVSIGFGPFLLYGVNFDISPFKGDLSPIRKEASLACFGGRRFADQFGIQNRSHVPVTLLAAEGNGSSAGIVERVATQFVLSPPYHPARGAAVADPVVRRSWSGAPGRPLTIPPGRIATVQSNYVFRHCGRLTTGHAVSVPGSVAVRYRISGRIRQKTIPSGLAFFAVTAPTRRTCGPLPGAISVVSSDTSCAATRRTALACHPLSHGSWGDCTSANVIWNCGRYGYASRHSSYHEMCWQGPQKLRAHWFSVRWRSPRT